jgi:hypothetical protein
MEWLPMQKVPKNAQRLLSGVIVARLEYKANIQSVSQQWTVEFETENTLLCALAENKAGINLTKYAQDTYKKKLQPSDAINQRKTK